MATSTSNPASLARRAIPRSYPRQEPSAVVPHAGICAGGSPSSQGEGLSLPRRKRRTTGMEKGMEESYGEDLASHDGPVHALATREGAAKRWIRGARRPGYSAPKW